MKYIKSFETEAAYEAGKSDLSIPYVAYTKDDEQVHYARRLEDLYNIVGTLVPGTESFDFRLNNSTTITPTIIGDRFVYNWTGSTITSLENAFSGKTALVSIDKFDVQVASSASTNNIFSGCNNLTKPFYYSGQTSINSYAFANCQSITELIIPSTITSIGQMAFYSCKGLTGTLNLPNTLITIEKQAFVNCTGLNTINIPDSVTTIGLQTFSGCSGVTIVEIGNSITSIGNNAFYQINGLQSFTCHAVTPPTLGTAIIYNPTNYVIYVPASSVEDYKAASRWSSYASRIQAIPNS